MQCDSWGFFLGFPAKAVEGSEFVADASLVLKNGPGFNVFKEWAQAVSRDPHRHGFECFSVQKQHTLQL
jgi:hypothetical protein